MNAIQSALILMCCLFTLSCQIAAEETPLIASGKTTTPWHKIPVVNTHLGPQGFVRIGKRLFSNVDGFPPYFVTVRGSNMVAFVTLSENDRVLHIATPETGKVISVPGFHFSFGSRIGSASLAPEEYDEAVILPNNRVLIRHSIAASRRDVIVDLTGGRVETTSDTPSPKPNKEPVGTSTPDRENSTTKPSAQEPAKR